MGKCAVPADLDDFAGIHHPDTVAGLGDDAEIVGHEQHAHTGVPPQTQNELQDLILNRHVESRGWFVRDQKFRTAGKRDGDQDALTHAAAELVRIGFEPSAGDVTPTCQKIDRRARACWRQARWRRSTSAICVPMGMVGLREVIGS